MDHAGYDTRIGQIIADYLAAIDVGAVPDPQALLGQFPDLAEDLAGFLTEQDRFRRLTEPLRSAADSIPAR